MNCRVATVAVSPTAAGILCSADVQRHLCNVVWLARRRDAHQGEILRRLSGKDWGAKGGGGVRCGHTTPIALRQRSRRDMTYCNASVAKPICLCFQILQVATAFASYHIEINKHSQALDPCSAVHMR